MTKVKSTDEAGADAGVRVGPANLVGREDLSSLFGARGPAHRCQCQRYRLAAGESFAGTRDRTAAPGWRSEIDEKFPGNPTRSFRSRHPLLITAQVHHWPGHDCQALQAMLGLQRLLCESGRDLIED